MLFRRFGPDVVLDMIQITEQDAINVTGVFRGVARRIVAVSSQDVYLAWGCVRGVDTGLTDPHIHEDSPLRQSRYMYRGVPLPAYSEWDLENYDKILVERVFQDCVDLPATIVRLPMVWSGRSGAPRVPVAETHGRRPSGDSAGERSGALAGTARICGVCGHGAGAGRFEGCRGRPHLQCRRTGCTPDL